MIESCLAPEQAGSYCKYPSFLLSCCHDRCRPDQGVVWALTPGHVAIRNFNSCGCEPAFVAGLAMPCQKITGLEYPRRPNGTCPI